MYIKRFTSNETETKLIRSFGGNSADDVNKVKNALNLDDLHTVKQDLPYQGIGLTKDVEDGIGILEFNTLKDTFCSVDDGSAIYKITKDVDGEQLAAIRYRNTWYKVRY